MSWNLHDSFLKFESRATIQMMKNREVERWKAWLQRHHRYSIEYRFWLSRQGAGRGIADVTFGNIRRCSTGPISPERVNVWGGGIEKSNGRCGVAVLLLDDDEAERSSLIAVCIVRHYRRCVTAADACFFFFRVRYYPPRPIASSRHTEEAAARTALRRPVVPAVPTTHSNSEKGIEKERKKETECRLNTGVERENDEERRRRRRRPPPVE